jgi:hypothetical protein
MTDHIRSRTIHNDQKYLVNQRRDIVKYVVIIYERWGGGIM